ncbi:MAG: hypothetical protein Terrestrivirus6_65 [Terrestrivirus sp.]|uniref:Transmembrane protein n=1 Tax=Terrestrivirus sp. TaxID=2487775 RepID=A0A3G4ZSN1_9VIRU|nr:MAG: hypothetical protein Terrestrivirus6_65 [Terrestrivirus sp.]
MQKGLLSDYQVVYDPLIPEPGLRPPSDVTIDVYKEMDSDSDSQPDSGLNSDIDLEEPTIYLLNNDLENHQNHQNHQSRQNHQDKKKLKIFSISIIIFCAICMIFYIIQLSISARLKDEPLDEISLKLYKLNFLCGLLGTIITFISLCVIIFGTYCQKKQNHVCIGFFVLAFYLLQLASIIKTNSIFNDVSNYTELNILLYIQFSISILVILGPVVSAILLIIGYGLHKLMSHYTSKYKSKQKQISIYL